MGSSGSTTERMLVPSDAMDMEELVDGEGGELGKGTRDQGSAGSTAERSGEAPLLLLCVSSEGSDIAELVDGDGGELGNGKRSKTRMSCSVDLSSSPESIEISSSVLMTLSS